METDKLDAIVGVLRPSTVAAILHDLVAYEREKSAEGKEIEPAVYDAVKMLLDEGINCMGAATMLRMITDAE
jgi:hypothetical protein